MPRHVHLPEDLRAPQAACIRTRRPVDCRTTARSAAPPSSPRCCWLTTRRRSTRRRASAGGARWADRRGPTDGLRDRPTRRGRWCMTRSRNWRMGCSSARCVVKSPSRKTNCSTISASNTKVSAAEQVVMGMSRMRVER